MVIKQNLLDIPTVYNEWFEVFDPRFKPFLGRNNHNIHLGFDTEYLSQETVAVSFAVIYRERMFGIVFDNEDFLRLTLEKKQLKRWEAGDETVLYDDKPKKALEKILHHLDKNTGLFKDRPLGYSRSQIRKMKENSVQLTLFETGEKTRGPVLNQLDVILCLSAHMTKADIFVLFAKKQLMSIRQALIPKKRIFKFETRNRNVSFNKLRLVDTHLFNFHGAKSLYKLGEALGVPKIEIPHERYEDMPKFRREEPDFFFHYSFNDAAISAVGAVDTMDNLKHLGVQGMTPGAVAAKYFTREAPETLNTIRVYAKGQNHVKGWDIHNDLKNDVARAFLGGRAEAEFFGTLEGRFYDLDLRSAYPTVLSTMRAGSFYKQHYKPFTTDNNEEFVNHFHPDECGGVGVMMGTYEIEFSSGYLDVGVAIDTHALFQTSFTVGADDGEIIEGIAPVMNGRAIVTAIECQAYAVAMREFGHYRIKRVNGRELRFSEPEGSLFGNFYTGLAKYRADAMKENKPRKAGAFKMVGNALSGKIGQGWANKYTYDFGKDANVRIPPAPMSNPFICSQMTAYCRAMMFLLRHYDDQIVAMNTDGFITKTPLEDILKNQKVLNNPIIQTYRRASERINGGDEWLQEKHCGDDLLLVNRNSAISIQRLPEKKPIHQTGWSIRTEGHSEDLKALVKAASDLKFTQTYGRLESLRRMRKSGHIHPESTTTEKRPSLAPDFKKRYFERAPRSGESFLRSRPYRNMEEAMEESRYWQKVFKAGKLVTEANTQRLVDLYSKKQSTPELKNQPMSVFFKERYENAKSQEAMFSKMRSRIKDSKKEVKMMLITKALLLSRYETDMKKLVEFDRKIELLAVNKKTAKALLESNHEINLIPDTDTELIS